MKSYLMLAIGTIALVLVPLQHEFGDDTGLYIFVGLGVAVIVGIFLYAIISGGLTMGQIGLAASISKTGYNSPETILLIRSLVMNKLKESLREDGIEVIDLDVVHEIGGIYQGMLETDGGLVRLKIVADSHGGLQWSPID